MKKDVYRFCAGFLAVILLSVLVVPCYAVTDEYTSTGTFWSSLKEKWWLGFGSKFLIGHLADSACSESPDSRHHGSLKTYNQNSDGSYTAICNYCSAEFPVYDADLSAAYNDYVETLPAPEITQTSLYTLYFRDYVYNEAALIGDNKFTYSSFIASPLYDSVKCQCTIFYNGTYGDFAARSAVLHVPVSGSYRLYGFKAPSGLNYSSTSNNNSFCLYKGTPDNYEIACGSVSDGYLLNLEAGNYFAYIKTRLKGSSYGSSGSTLNAVLSLVPLNQSTPVSNVYLADTRPTSITGGALGIADVDANGQLTGTYTKIDDHSSIVNETNNTYWNPVTNTTSSISNWSYDYSDRSYKVDYTTTNVSGDTITNTSTITYGDEYITITEIDNSQGDTITNNYTIYYLIDGSGSVTPPCDHDWQASDGTLPTCTRPGSASYVCSKCQQTKTEALPALGHDWQVKQTVTTQYDEAGQLVQEGYTIFECSRCHEQYKSLDGTIPPGGSGTDPGSDEDETIWDKLGKLLGTAVKALLDLLGSAVDVILGGLIDLITNLVESLKQLVDLFGTVGEAFQVLWTWLPPEITAILAAGVSIFVFVALLKFFMK